jgi:hypothetical protein
MDSKHAKFRGRTILWGFARKQNVHIFGAFDEGFAKTQILPRLLLAG